MTEKSFCPGTRKLCSSSLDISAIQPHSLVMRSPADLGEREDINDYITMSYQSSVTITLAPQDSDEYRLQGTI